MITARQRAVRLVAAVIFGVLAIVFITRGTTFSTVMGVIAAALTVYWIYAAIALKGPR
ncbi:hypothetical protein [Cellulomonas endometrii]|uniref:hypothetical protein n=1 Tax=Cellulomonas endometrii TaxID=3036301 RepID=UPI0024AD1BF0|nr:hypothetical protein [Cellulomonas endometrii]